MTEPFATLVSHPFFDLAVIATPLAAFVPTSRSILPVV
jgi:hypothetical protein